MKKAALALLVLGLLRMTGDVLGLRALVGIGTASGASPAPKVFSAVQGLETFSTRFFVQWTDTTGASQELQLTPEVYARIEGPYNRRNVYGAALAYGPVLAGNDRTRAMFEAVLVNALCGEAPLLRELGLDPARIAGNPSVRYEPRSGSATGDLPLRIEAACR